jgi:hypothetical protein
MEISIQIKGKGETTMADDFSNIKNYRTPPFEQDESGGQQFKQPKKTRIEPRICFIITQKKNSSWVEDLCNREMISPKDLVVYH